MAYSILAATESELFDEIFVSTDSEQYAEIAVDFGASVPFLRSEKTSSDNASSWDAVAEVLDRYEKLDRHFDTFALLQPTSPLRKAEDIRNAHTIFRERDANAVVGVCETPHSPLWCNTLPADLSLMRFLRKDIADLPRQSLPKYYIINGSLYWVKTTYFLQNHDIYREKAFACIMPRERSIDIDDELDFHIAEAIMGYSR